MSSDKSNCGCGSSCGCGSGCNCNYPTLDSSEKTTKETIIVGVAPVKRSEASDMRSGAQNEGCKCGPNCKCDPCNC